MSNRIISCQSKLQRSTKYPWLQALSLNQTAFHSHIPQDIAYLYDNISTFNYVRVVEEAECGETAHSIRCWGGCR